MMLDKIRIEQNSQVFKWLFMGYAFFIPFSRAGISLFTLLILLAFLFKKGLKNDLQKAFNNKFVKFIFIFIGFSFISILWSENLSEYWNYNIRYWYFIPLVVIATNLKKSDVESLISAFLLGMVISEVTSYGVFFELWKYNGVSPKDPSPFMNHIQYSVFVVFTSLLLLVKIFNHNDFKMKLIYSLFFITVTLNIFINAGRVGYIIFFITLLMTLLMNVQSKVKAFLVFLLLTVTLLFGAYNFSEPFEIRINKTVHELSLIGDSKFYAESFGERVGLYYLSYQILQDNPIIGVGVGDEMDQLDIYLDKPKNENFYKLRSTSHFHNLFAHIGAQLGVIGVLLILLAVYYSYKIELRNNYFINIKFIFLTIFYFVSMTGNMIHQQFTMALFSLIIGIILSLSLNEKINEKKSDS